MTSFESFDGIEVGSGPEEEIVLEGDRVMTPEEYEAAERKHEEETARFIERASKNMDVEEILSPRDPKELPPELKKAA